jgi:hypothetical protein
MLPAKIRIPEFTVFVLLLQMVMKYDFFDVFEQLFEDLEGAYPTRWKNLEAAIILGESIFGSPKPHPSKCDVESVRGAGVRFAIPFAAYRVSLGGFPAVMDNRPDIKICRKFPHRGVITKDKRKRLTRFFLNFNHFRA